MEPSYTFVANTDTGVYQHSQSQPQLVVDGQPTELIKFERNALIFKQPLHINSDIFVQGEKLDIISLNKLGKKPIVTIMNGKEQIGVLNLATMSFYGKTQGDIHNTTVCVFDSWLTATIVITWMVKHVVMWVKEKYELGKKLQEMEELYK